MFGELAAEVVPGVEAAHRKRLDRPGRQRATGGGDDFDLSTTDQVLLTVVWLRLYPTNEVLGFCSVRPTRPRVAPAPGAWRHWSARGGTRLVRRVNRRRKDESGAPIDRVLGSVLDQAGSDGSLRRGCFSRGWRRTRDSRVWNESTSLRGPARG